MTIFHALFLGLLQGFTEFLPVSSSGHLVLTETFFGIPQHAKDMQAFDVILHAGSLLAIIIVYIDTWKTIFQNHSDQQHGRSLLALLVVATIPAGVLGILLEDIIAQSFRSVSTVGGAFLITALALYLSERSVETKKQDVSTGFHSLRVTDVLIVGIAQACALIPGISRSGFTISAGRAVGLSRREALDFSFLLATPVMAGASVLTMLNIVAGEIVLPSMSAALIGFVASAISSFFVIRILRQFVSSHSLAWFCWYLVPVGVFLIL